MPLAHPTHRLSRRQALAVLGLAAGLGAATASRAGDAAAKWPNRPVRIVVPYAAGGSVDILTRLLAQKLSEELGQPVVVDNKGGAGGNVGAQAVARGSYDDHCFLMASQSQLSINQFIFQSMGYDPAVDFKAIGLVAQTTNVIVVPSALPVTSFQGLLDYSKAHPGKVAYSSAGIGSTGHLLNELLKTTTGIDAVHVPYKGNGPAMQAVIAGEVQFNTDNMPQLLQQIKAGRLRPLAVTSSKRWFQLPHVPTTVELGFPSLTAVVWFGLVAQAKVPDDIVRRMNAAINKILADRDFAAKLRENSLEGTPGTPEQMARHAESERVRWKAVVSASGAKAD